MGNKLTPEARAREEFARSLRDSKRRFNAQNKSGLLFEAEARFALQAAGNNNQLLKCDMDTVKDAMAHLAAMGLSLNPASQQAALIPRWNSKRGCLECTASPQYRGLMKLATDTGLITSISAELVFECEEDTFDVDLGSRPYLKHKPKLFAGKDERVVDLKDPDRNKLIGAYCIAHLRDSEYPHISVMDISEIMQIANASDAFNPRPAKGGRERKAYGPWLQWPGEMVKKAVIRRASKQWPLSDDRAYQRLLTAIEIDNQAEANEQHAEVRVEQEAAELGEPCTRDQVERLKDLMKQQNLSLDVIYENYKINSLTKLPQTYFDEVEAKLLDRLKRYNEARANAEKESAA